ncbi:HAMP domain-containing sensor histidine kinase [Sorangium sp. So ce260]|uniref:sensor histidine kinase n=1 Tax=Sorangium sp. So ce260 TaxID=3133291 RepID=UPI003F603A13
MDDGRARGGPLPFFRSLRFRVTALVVAVLFAPTLLVLAWLSVERRVLSHLVANADFCARVAAAALDEHGGAAGPPDARALARVQAVAEEHLLRLRVVDGAGAVVADFDHDQGTDLSQRVGDLLLGAIEAEALETFDASLGPIAQRPEFQGAQQGTPQSACQLTKNASLLVCHAVHPSRHGYVYAQDSSRRPVAHLLYLRIELPRLVAITLPLSLVLAFWLTSRFVRPLEALRRRALAKIHEPTPSADLPLQGSAEMQDVAAAFNALLAALAERRKANEAFVADLVHEFKNPVATIRGCADALAEAPAERERAARLSRLLKDSSRRLDTLVSQFLELARAEAGMLHEARERVDVAALARGLVVAMADDDRFARIRFTVSGAASARIVGVAYRVESVLRNLLENAASFSGDGGKVHVSVDVLEGRRVEIRVCDTGPGISEEDRPRVFDRFFTTRGREQGSGLGLALVRAVVEAHGGAVSAASNPGRGATFVVALPLAPAG